MQKNVSGQEWIVFAFDLTDGTAKTGDAANITADLYIDNGSANAIDDTNPTEIAHGYYKFTLSQAETNGDHILIDPVSTTSNIQVVGVPGVVYTTPPNFPALGIESDGDITKVNTVGAGPGDYAVTLTIRTTGGTAVSGVSVWVNSSNDRTGSVAGTKITDTNGQVIFNLEYTTYYVFCHLSGYTFASASFTAAAGSVTFTKDIATATSSGSSSYYTESFITRALADAREALDEPTQNAKYTDARIISMLEKSYMLILNEKNRCSKTPIVAKIDKTISSGTTIYPLPHTTGTVYGIYKSDSSGGKVFYDSRSRYNSYGRGMWLEGQNLHIQTTDMYGIGTSITVEYIPSGIARLHNGTCTINSAGTVVTFGTTPNAGTLDTHHEAYSGCIFRCLGVSGTTVTGNYLQERTITAYDETTRQATLNAALDPIPTTDDGYIYYEIAPAISKGMDTIVAIYAAYRIASREGNIKRANSILKLYQQEIRNVRLDAFYSLMPEAPVDRKDNFDNRRYNRF